MMTVGRRVVVDRRPNAGASQSMRLSVLVLFRSLLLVLFLLLLAPPVDAFAVVAVPASGTRKVNVGYYSLQAVSAASVSALRMSTTSSSSHNEIELPSVEELESGPMMKQVNFAQQLVPLIGNPKYDVALVDRLKAIMSYGNGLRGFFATYLTWNTGEDTAADKEEIPVPLATAMKETNNATGLVLNMCMNVIMPTAMISKYAAMENPNPDSIQQSTRTASRSVRILKALLDYDSTRSVALEQCHALLAVATDAWDETTVQESWIHYWKNFFKLYDYQQVQKQDIAATLKSILDEKKDKI